MGHIQSVYITRYMSVTLIGGRVSTKKNRDFEEEKEEKEKKEEGKKERSGKEKKGGGRKKGK